MAFEDFLTATVTALAAETMEDEYLAMVERHKDGQPGKRSIDLIAKLFAQLIEAMTRNDWLLEKFVKAARSYFERAKEPPPDFQLSTISGTSSGSVDPRAGECTERWRSDHPDLQLRLQTEMPLRQ